VVHATQEEDEDQKCDAKIPIDVTELLSILIIRYFTHKNTRRLEKLYVQYNIFKLFLFELEQLLLLVDMRTLERHCCSLSVMVLMN